MGADREGAEAYGKFKPLGATVRATSIIYAHPDTLELMGEYKQRFAGRRTSILDRFYAAYLVFVGRADALCWDDFDK